MVLKQKQISSGLASTIKYFLMFAVGAMFSLLSYGVYRSSGSQLSLMFCYRVALVVAFCSFLIINILIDYKTLYNFLFNYRYAIAFILFVVLVAAKINFSSIGMFEKYVQPGSGSDFVNPVFGVSRAIRSDEWAIATPKTLTYQYCAGEKYNDIIMASKTLNIKSTDVAPSLSMVAKPFYWGFLFLSTEYAVSFFWCSMFIVGLLAGIEFFLIITKENRMYSFLGSVMVMFSSFTMWWNANTGLTYVLAAIAGIYRFLNTDTVKKRIISGLSVLVFGTAFVGILYPAWQVPAGYICLAIIIWCFVVNWGNVKKFKTVDWVIFSSVVALALAVLGVFALENVEYTKSVMNTVYPGTRREYGGFVLNNLFTYPATLLFPFKTGEFAFSEYGMFFSMYPLPTLVAIYTLFKTRKKDLLTILLLIVSAIFTVYCTVGVPKWFGDISLLSFSMPVRTLTFLDFIQIPILLRAMALMKENNCFIPKFVIIPLALILSVFTVYWCDKKFVYSDFMSTTYMVVITVVIFAVEICLVGKVDQRLKTAAMVALIIIHCGVSLFVLPIQKGLDAIYSKPAAQAVMKIAQEDPDARWIAADQWVEANFYAACGAKVINSNNYVPNYELWEILDPEGAYNEVYNRYANFIVTMTTGETEAILNQPDLITLRLNYGQLDDIDVKYLITKSELLIPEEYNISAQQLYAENGVYIYSISF